MSNDGDEKNPLDKVRDKIIQFHALSFIREVENKFERATLSLHKFSKVLMLFYGAVTTLFLVNFDSLEKLSGQGPVLWALFFTFLSLLLESCSYIKLYLKGETYGYLEQVLSDYQQKLSELNDLKLTTAVEQEEFERETLKFLENSRLFGVPYAALKKLLKYLVDNSSKRKKNESLVKESEFVNKSEENKIKNLIKLVREDENEDRAASKSNPWSNLIALWPTFRNFIIFLSGMSIFIFSVLIHKWETMFSWCIWPMSAIRLKLGF